MSLRPFITPVLLFLVVLLSSITFSWEVNGHGKKSHEKEILISADELPGVTWADDIHPIFIRNKCYNCHTRGDEDMVENLSEFALGMVDQKDPSNSYYSFHELVYTEGKPNIIEGEVLRDGQCCWPRDYPVSQQRRIWLGHPERSVLLRKLERDYYDWNKPPRYLEEGLRLSWGLPMPMWSSDDEEVEGRKEERRDDSLSPSIWREVKLRVKLMVGRGHEEIAVLPSPIPASDRALIRLWINNALQLQSEGTSLSIRLKNKNKSIINNKDIRLVGNLVTSTQKTINEVFDLKTDNEGFTSLEFPKGSVVSLVWNVGIRSEHDIFKYREVKIKPGVPNSIVIDI